MMDAGALLLTARLGAGLSQRQLAERAGTSGATVAAYESGVKEPRLSTLARLVEAAGGRLVVDVEVPAPVHVPAMTREDRRNLALHRAVAARLVRNPRDVMAKARANLSTLRAAHPEPNPWLDEWARLLTGPPTAVVRALVSTDPASRELRQNSPFAGVLSAAERRRALERRHAS